METIEKIIQEGKQYQGIRSLDRQKQYGEVFTPTTLVMEILGKLPPEVWEEGSTFCDPAAGNGQFLAAVLMVKLFLGHDRLGALESIYGVELLFDNVEVCRARLLKISSDGINDAKLMEQAKEIVTRNIVCADGLMYDYEFNNENK